ncbi:probable methyltransferase At1g27930 [Salvia hispanica]|uniref:probable methyltransferase At1g27930 n=1 Tax=Salvia hispanica TaxID=49212 RepID=UPI002009A18E|nr:probable methyltransferase At1g27930 [Salvia hispanica]
MPPHVTHYHPPLLPRLSPHPRPKHLKQGKVGMKFIKKKIILVLLFILCTASIFRLLNISIFAQFSLSLPSAALIHHSYNSQPPLTRNSISTKGTGPTLKETRFILDLFSRLAPCNVLVFGSANQYSSIASMNSGGATVFLEDYLDSRSTSTSITRPNNTRVHKIMYSTRASEAYQLLRDARGNPECLPESQTSRCSLAMTNLPGEVYDTMWDVVVVDGPDGGGPYSPGRMASIYTAGVLARRGNSNSNSSSHVVVHDVDRMIEKWFSWEFLCEENLVSSKGRFWHFRIGKKTNATTFCTP